MGGSHGKMEGVSLGELWCQCQGNASATPHFLLVDQQMARVHVAAQWYAVCYVGVVLSLYLLGVVLILRWERYSECSVSTAAAALVECLSCSECTSEDESDDDEEVDDDDDDEDDDMEQEEEEEVEEEEEEGSRPPSRPSVPLVVVIGAEEAYKVTHRSTTV